MCVLSPLADPQPRGLQDGFPPPLLVLGDAAEDLCVHLRLHHARPHHHRLLRPHDPAAQERAHAVGLPGDQKIWFYLQIPELL